MKLFSNQSLEKALDYSALKQRVISNNIANVDTPNYKAKKVSFKSELNQAKLQANRTDMNHFTFKGNSSSGIVVETNKYSSYNHNGNNVDIDTEMTDMAKNQIYYNTLVERLNGKFNALKEVLKGGN